MPYNQNQQGQNGQQRKFYSFLNLTRCVNKAGNPFIGVVLKGPVTRPDKELTFYEMGGQNTATFHFRLPCQSRGEYINAILQEAGMPSVQEDATSTVWCQVSLFGKCAERFAKLMDKHSGGNPIVCVVGSLKSETYTGQNGVAVSLKITASDFFLVSEGKSASANGNGNANGGYQPAAPAPQQGQGGGWGQPAAPAPAPQQGQGGWGQPAAPAPAPQQGQGGGWGQSAAPAPVPQQGRGGSWGQSAAPAPAPQQGQGGGWGQQTYAPPTPGASDFADLDDEDGELPF